MSKDDDAFLHWFAGFVDGEGCFFIKIYPPGSNCRQFPTHLAIQLRDDDLDILLELQQRLQMGTITRNQLVNSPSNPIARWCVATITDCKRLVEIFNVYPLRTKKRRDFEIWRQAVAENCKDVSRRDLDKMRYLHDRLKLVRKYETSNNYVVYETENIQLTLPFKEGSDE